ncbi:hypothetical protein J6590_047647 [Homalodisca vitripennis]|nr:hypothetical protein J6590_047647 [Homalodisca vitripennis]
MRKPEMNRIKLKWRKLKSIVFYEPMNFMHSRCIGLDPPPRTPLSPGDAEDWPHRPHNRHPGQSKWRTIQWRLLAINHSAAILVGVKARQSAPEEMQIATGNTKNH